MNWQLKITWSNIWIRGTIFHLAGVHFVGLLDGGEFAEENSFVFDLSGCQSGKVEFNRHLITWLFHVYVETLRKTLYHFIVDVFFINSSSLPRFMLHVFLCIESWEWQWYELLWLGKFLRFDMLISLQLDGNFEGKNPLLLGNLHESACQVFLRFNLRLSSGKMYCVQGWKGLDK